MPNTENPKKKDSEKRKQILINLVYAISGWLGYFGAMGLHGWEWERAITGWPKPYYILGGLSGFISLLASYSVIKKVTVIWKVILSLLIGYILFYGLLYFDVVAT